MKKAFVPFVKQVKIRQEAKVKAWHKKKDEAAYKAIRKNIKKQLDEGHSEDGMHILKRLPTSGLIGAAKYVDTTPAPKKLTKSEIKEDASGLATTWIKNEKERKAKEKAKKEREKKERKAKEKAKKEADTKEKAAKEKARKEKKAKEKAHKEKVKKE